MTNKTCQGVLMTAMDRERIFPASVRGGVYATGNSLKCIKAIFGSNAIYGDNEDMEGSILYHRSPILSLHLLMLKSVGQLVRVLVVKDKKDYDRGMYLIETYDEETERFHLKKKSKDPAKGTIGWFFAKQ